VDVYAYMMHMPVARWGREFLERGAARLQVLQPVYDGDTARGDGAGGVRRLRDRGPRERQAVRDRRASLPLADSDEPRSERYPLAPLPAPEERAPASAASLAKGTVLGTFSLEATDELVRNYLRDVRETDELYRREG
jgi:hypothetical protein